jgi:chromosome segregation protein
LYLKSLSLRGFKTFADKTVIEFNPPGSVTAIVGPNGCGKSNLVDAIRWVLGEQNPKELRSPALEQVIFAGSSARKPLSLAEVSIELDNTDNKIKTEFAELSVRRRTFRSGESEFSINKANCRLKDIRDLFLDTGLGAGSYSIISQGQVDAILSSKPEDRRAIFEEAAKINKYKFRKTAAERKLISTEQNMLRIADLKSEISNQLNILEAQAKKAAQFLELKDKLKTLEVALAKKQIKGLNDKKVSIEEKMSALKSQMELGFNIIQQYENERTAKKDSFRSLEGEIEGLRLLVSQSKLSYEENKSLILLDNEKKRNLEERIAEAKTQAENFKSKLSSLFERKAELDEQLKKDSYVRSQVSDDLSSVEGAFERIKNEQESLDAEIASLKSDIIEKEELLSREKNKLIELESNLRLAQEEHKHDEALIKKLDEERRALASKVDELRTKATSLVALLKEKDSKLKIPERSESLKASFSVMDAALEKIFGKKPSHEINIDISLGAEIKIKNVKLNDQIILSGGELTGGSAKDKIRELISKEREIETLIEQAKVDQESGAKDLELKQVIEEIGLIERSLEARTRELADISIKKDLITASLITFENERQKLNNKLSALSEKLIATVKEKEMHLSLLAEKKAAAASVNSKYENLVSEVEKVDSDIRSINDYMGSRNIEEMQSRLADTHNHIKELEESLPRFREEEQSHIKKMASYTSTKAALEKDIEALDKKLSGGASDERIVRDALAKEEVAMAKLEGELAAISERMMAEYTMTIADIMASVSEISPNTKAKEEADGLRKAVADLGPVNLLATEEFEKARERFSFIDTQFNDLVIARENLTNLIKELDEKARADFIETLKIINKNFSEIFATLFEGGEAKLEINEGEDILEGGIEIIARPGGKRWLNLGAMSGGERALTAIALLFALLRTHPSPFCLLDEADAALDEANVHRYAKLLKEFSKSMQVVLITHNKQTMEIADTMYGVTMEEPGISRIISVKLAKAA